MVTQEIDNLQARDRRSRRQQRYHTGAIGPQIDIIAQMYQDCRSNRTGGEIHGDQTVKRHQAFAAAMNVPNRVGSSAARHPTWGAQKPDRLGGGCDWARSGEGRDRSGFQCRSQAEATAGAHHTLARLFLLFAILLAWVGKSNRRNPLAKITFPVEASHIMMFARSVGDTNPVYHDAAAAKDTGAGGIVAPPTFAQAVAQFDPNYYLRPKPGEKWFGSAKGPSGIEGKPPSSGGLHAEQHYEYHRHLRPGDVLTVETKPGKTWEKESKRAGKLTFSERVTEYRDQNGELVITARGVGVTTERPVDQG